MSLSEIRDCACPACGAVAPLEFWSSLERDERDNVLTGSLQRHSCISCGAETRFPPALTYFDADAGLWLAARPPEAATDWAAAELEAHTDFKASFGDAAPLIAQELGKALRGRLTFGWPALREKLLLSAFGLDDVTAELVKLVVLRDRAGNPLTQGTDLRVTDLRGPTLELAWMDSVTGIPVDVFEAPLALYDTLKNDETWAQPRATMTDGLFVDIGRILNPSK